MILDKLKQPASDDSDYVIDLAAMLGLMVTLIPMLLLSTAFVTINAVEVEVPLSVSAETTTGDDDKSDEKYTTLEVHVAKEITLLSTQIKALQETMEDLYETVFTSKLKDGSNK